jgi:hypothetical protein
MKKILNTKSVDHLQLGKHEITTYWQMKEMI